MSRSYKRNPWEGITTAESDKPFKSAENRRRRRAEKIAISRGDDPPDSRLFGDPWRSPKDGKARRPHTIRK